MPFRNDPLDPCGRRIFFIYCSESACHGAFPRLSSGRPPTRRLHSPTKPVPRLRNFRFYPCQVRGRKFLQAAEHIFRSVTFRVVLEEPQDASAARQFPDPPSLLLMRIAVL